MLDKFALAMGYGIMTSLGLLLMSIIIYVCIGLTATLLKKMYTDYLLEVYRLESLRYYMAVMRNRGRKGLRKHAESEEKP